MNVKICKCCFEEKDIGLFHNDKSRKDGKQYRCKECASVKDSFCINRPEINRRSWLKTKYGLSEEDYLQMYQNQKGCCAICGTAHDAYKRVLAVDHCHVTGKVRALLCMNCNTLIGQAKDDSKVLQNAINYLNRYAT